jgi:signal transduction histidine kinase
MKKLGFVKRFFSVSLKSSKSAKDIEYEELKKKVKLLEKQIEEKSHAVEFAKSAFLKNIYHEIRTPLNVILGFSNLLEYAKTGEKETHNYLSYIREGSNDFLRKMDDIIQASIIEAGIVKIENSECKLYDLLEGIHSYFSFHKHIINKDLAFLMTVPEELKEICVLCDAYRVKQVMGNLLMNAFKFTSKGVVEFGYKIVKEEVEFFIRDTGIGGLEGKEDIVFDYFSKVDDSDTAPEGLGLGLNLASRLVKIMNGTIWFNSVESKGTTFYFTIPYIPVHVKKDILEQQINKHVPVSTMKTVQDKTVVC